MPTLQEEADRRNAEREGRRVAVTENDLKGAHARIDRLETKVDTHNVKLADVAEKVSWIKGYLEQQPEAPVPVFRRDAGMVTGGAGLAGVVIYLLERLFNGG